MNGTDPTGKVAQRLQEALDRLHKDLERVDIWAAALIAFAGPIPDLAPRNDNLLPRQNSRDQPASLADGHDMTDART